jgi:hypothetical protein
MIDCKELLAALIYKEKYILKYYLNAKKAVPHKKLKENLNISYPISDIVKRIINKIKRIEARKKSVEVSV